VSGGTRSRTRPLKSLVHVLFFQIVAGERLDEVSLNE
jgi:hypothetical protein